MSEASVQDTLEAYLEGVAISRSPNTARTYTNAVNAFSASMRDRDRDPESTDAHMVTENWIVDFVRYLSSYAPASERLYLTALTGWYEYLAAEKQAEIKSAQTAPADSPASAAPRSALAPISPKRHRNYFGPRKYFEPA